MELEIFVMNNDGFGLLHILKFRLRAKSLGADNVILCDGEVINHISLSGQYQAHTHRRTMMSVQSLSLFILILQVSSVASLLLLPDLSFKSIKKAYLESQRPIMPLDVPGILMPGSSGEKNKMGSDELSISDVIGK